MNATNNLSVFLFGEKPVRTAGTPESPLFVAKDVCDVLDVKNSRDAISALDEDEIASVAISDTSSSSRKSVPMQVVTESGLYHLIFKSRKKQAQKFRRWVTEEVLPQIRQQGSYAPQQRKLTNRDILEYALEQEIQMERQSAALGMASPKGEYGEVSEKSGEPRVQLVPAYFRTPQSQVGAERGAEFATLRLQLELPLNQII
eukprot:Seg18458.1 transcript_id=Seg18458.1/GoldUCD/mRNA.D3Y31 product="putative protein" protein_id=Seg18458.1/GoldUCD/D3Y31